MTDRKKPGKWDDLTPGQQNAIKVLAVTDLIAKIVMLVDIRRRRTTSWNSTAATYQR